MYAVASVIGSSYAAALPRLWKRIEGLRRMASGGAGGGSDPKPGGNSPPAAAAEGVWKKECTPVGNISELIALLPNPEVSFECAKTRESSVSFPIILPIRTGADGTIDPSGTTRNGDATLLTSAGPYVWSMITPSPGNPTSSRQAYRFENATDGIG
jgi:hypothetical protein